MAQPPGQIFAGRQNSEMGRPAASGERYCSGPGWQFAAVRGAVSGKDPPTSFAVTDLPMNFNGFHGSQRARIGTTVEIPGVSQRLPQRLNRRTTCSPRPLERHC
jgi:hypothetical protein